MRSTARTALLCLAAGLFLVPTAARGQMGGARGPDVHLSGGVLAPLSMLSTSDISFSTEVSSSAAVSGGMTYWLGALGVAARGAWAPAQLGLRPTGIGGAVPDDLGEAEYLAGSVDVVYRLRLSGPASAVEPYVALGGGVRRLELDALARPEVRSSTDAMGTIAGGARVALWPPAALRFEVRDHVSRFDATETGDSKLQNDILVTVGLSVRP